MMTRHITVSTQQGMVTELEMMGQGFGPGERYILRFHKTRSASDRLDVADPDRTSTAWSGFCYRNNEMSMLVLRPGRSSGSA